MIVDFNDSLYVVDTEKFQLIKESFTDEDGIDYRSIEEWVKHNGLPIGEDVYILSRKEVESIVREFARTFISRENNLCELVIKRMMDYTSKKK